MRALPMIDNLSQLAIYLAQDSLISLSSSTNQKGEEKCLAKSLS